MTTTRQTEGIEALRALGAKKLVVASPYHDDQNRQVKDPFEKSGFEVLDIRGLRQDVAEIHEVPSALAYRHAKSVFLETKDETQCLCHVLTSVFPI